MNNNRSNQRPLLTLPGTLDSIRAIGEYVLDASDVIGLEKSVSLRLRLAVEEIATNAVVHGYQRTSCPGNLLVAAHYNVDRLTIILEDNGPAYDPRQTPPPDDLGRPLVERPEGGLGIYLALMGVDEYDYQWADGVNRNIFAQFLDR